MRYCERHRCAWLKNHYGLLRRMVYVPAPYRTITYDEPTLLGEVAQPQNTNHLEIKFCAITLGENYGTHAAEPYW